MFVVPLVVIAAAYFIVWLWNRPDPRFRTMAHAAIRSSLPHQRVRCLGRPAQIARVLRIDSIDDRMFEPRAYWAIAAVAGDSRLRWMQGIVGIVAFAAITWMEYRFSLSPFSWMYFNAMCAAAIGMTLGAAAIPTYIRIVPGRIDLMTFNLLGRKVASVEHIDLRGSMVRVDLRTQVVAIGEPLQARNIAFGGVWHRWEFAHTLLLAAISTHTPPPLPDDALVG